MKPYFESDGITIYHADCREILPEIEPVDLLLTDPPYGVSFKGKKTKNAISSNNYGYITGDSNIGPEIVKQSLTIAKRAIVFPGTRLLFKYPEPTEVGFVYCPSGAGLGRWGFTTGQPILYYGKCPYLSNGLGHRPNGFESFKTQPPNGHPCPKPLEWMKWAVIKGTIDESENILDPFMGSGTTLRAARDLGRRAIGIEIEEKYCEIAANRLAQKVLF